VIPKKQQRRNIQAWEARVMHATISKQQRRRARKLAEVEWTLDGNRYDGVYWGQDVSPSAKKAITKARFSLHMGHITQAQFMSLVDQAVVEDFKNDFKTTTAP
jgi:hypothetical protein